MHKLMHDPMFTAQVSGANRSREHFTALIAPDCAVFVFKLLMFRFFNNALDSILSVYVCINISRINTCVAYFDIAAAFL